MMMMMMMMMMAAFVDFIKETRSYKQL